MAAQTKTTNNHETIKKWVEDRGGQPATVEGTRKGNQIGMLRISFPDYSKKEALKTISWDDFFKKFDEKNLTFLYQDKTRDGKESRFFKFIRSSS